MKRLISWVLALAMLCSCLQWNLVFAADETTHTHDDGTEWVSLESALSGFKISGSAYVMTSGNYYVASDFELDYSLFIGSGVTVTLCLNDCLLSIAKEHKHADDVTVADSMIVVYGGTFTLMDDGDTARYWDTDAQEIVTGIDGDGTSTNNFVGGALTGAYNDRDVLGGGAVCVYLGTFIMNSGNIVGNATDRTGILGAGVYVNSNAVFTMNGGSIIGNTSGGLAGAVYIQCKGTFTLNDGVIAYNSTGTTANYAGAVYNVGTFTMNGGLIDSNESMGGGAVSTVAGWADGSGVFTMNGGTISNNYAATAGGGVLVGSGGTFVMNAGEIINNTTSGAGGAINLLYENSTVSIYNGTIAGNTALGVAGGIRVNGGTLNIGQASADSSIVIKDNTVNGTQSNVYLFSGSTITQVGSLDDSCTVGVTLETGTGIAAFSSTSPVYAITAADTTWYLPDQNYYRILEDDAVILLNAGTIPGYEDEIVYSADAYDLAQLFDLTARHGEATYTIAESSTGVGVINGNLLTVTKVGTFEIEITTSYTTTAEPKTGTATLVVTPKAVTIADLLAESRAIIAGDTAVHLDETSGSISGLVDGDAVSIDFSDYIANIQDEAYDLTGNYEDGAHDFDVSVADLTLTGEAADNYYITDIEDTTVTIKKEVLSITWPTSGDIYTNQTQAADAILGAVGSNAEQAEEGRATLTDTSDNTITIEGVFSWVEPSTELQAAGTYTGAVIFTPDAKYNGDYDYLFSSAIGAVDYTVNPLPDPTTLEGTDKTMPYQAEAIDVTALGMFDVTGLTGVAYTITPVTGEGVISGATVDVSKVGTFTVTVTADADETARSGYSGTATLTITPLEVTIEDLVAEDRGPIENYYGVTLVQADEDGAVNGSIDGIIDDDDVSINFSGYSALITEADYDDISNYTDDDGAIVGEADFEVAVTSLSLAGTDATNYVLVEIEETTVTIKMEIPYIAWPASTNITYGQNQAENTELYGGKVLVLGTDGVYTEIAGTFEWVEATSEAQDAGTYTGTVKFVEASSTPAGNTTGSYQELLAAETREVSYLIEAVPVQFSVSNNSAAYGSYVNPVITVVSSGSADTPVEGKDYNVLYLRLVNGVYEYVTNPTEVGTYFIGVEFNTNSNSSADALLYNYYHTGTIVSTAKQIGVLCIYEYEESYNADGEIVITASEPEGYDVSFTGFDYYDITDALPQTIHILPTLDTEVYLGWETELGVFYDFGSRFPQPEYDVTFTAVLAEDNNNISGVATGKDLDGTENTVLSNIGVVLMSGNTQIATTETDENGYYSFSVMPGRYTVEFTRDQDGVKNIESVFADATDGDIMVDVYFPNGRYNVELNLAAGMDSITVDGLQDILEELSDDKTVENSVAFNINQVDITTEEYQEILDAAAENGLTTDNIKLFYDVQITQELVEGTVTGVDALEDTIFAIYIPLSGIYQAKQSYTVYRNDGTEVDLLIEDKNNDGEYIDLIDDGKTLVIYAKKSAIYAISFIEPAPTVLTGTDVTKTYSRSSIDVSALDMFDLTGLGDATYTITPVTGEGEIDGTTLTVSTVGTFTITVTTAATSTASAMQGTATLTIEPKSVAISDLVAVSRGPVEGDDYVALDDTVEGTIIGVINNDDVSVSYEDSYGRITDSDYTDYTNYDADGNATFAVVVGGVALTGADKDNYVIVDVADTTVIININIPYIAWPTAPDINYHDDLSASTLYGGKVIVFDHESDSYVELDGYFEWLDTAYWLDQDGVATTEKVAESDIGTYTQLVRFVEDTDAAGAPADTSYRDLLTATTHEVEVIIKATSVQFEISDNDVAYDGKAHEATVEAVASSGEDITGDYIIQYFQFTDDGITYISAPTEVGTYLISGEFTSSNYHHAGTLEYTAKQIGVLNIYESEPTATYTVTFEGYEDLTILGAHAEDIHILPSITEEDGTVSTVYSGWSYNGSVYAFGARFPQPASDVLLTPVEAAATYTLSGTVYGVDLDGTEGTVLNKIGVAIMQGSETIATGETDENGAFSFELATGSYTVVITRDQIVYNEVSIYLQIEDEDVSLGHIVLPDTAQNTVVEIAANVSVDSVDGVEALLAYYLEQDGTMLSNTIYVNVDPIDNTNANLTEFNAITALAAENGITTDTLKVFFDITVSRAYNGETTVIHTIPDGEYLTFYIPLSGLYQNKEEYYVYRYHTDENGQVRVDIIGENENEYGESISITDDGQTMVLKAKFYSVYGIAYVEEDEEVTIPPTDDDVPDDDVAPDDDVVPDDDTAPDDDVASDDDVAPDDDIAPDDDVAPDDDTEPEDGDAQEAAYHSLSYSLNGGQGSLPSLKGYQEGATVTVKSNTVVRDGYIFTGWLNSVNGKVYQAGESFTMPTESVVLIAQWSLVYNPVNVPETGDISHRTLLVVLMGVFGVGMFFTRKKQPKKQGK